MVREQFAHLGEHANDLDIHSDRGRTVQDTGEHKDTMFRETERWMTKAHLVARIGGHVL